MPNSRIVRILDQISSLSADIREENALSLNDLELTQRERARRFTQAGMLVNLTQLATIHLMRDGAATYDADSRASVLIEIDAAMCEVRGLLQGDVAAEVRDLARRVLRLAGAITGEKAAAA